MSQPIMTSVHPRLRGWGWGFNPYVIAGSECPSNNFMFFSPLILPQLSQCNNSQTVFIPTVEARLLRVLLCTSVLSLRFFCLFVCFFLIIICLFAWSKHTNLKLKQKCIGHFARWLFETRLEASCVLERKSTLRQLPVCV